MCANHPGLIAVSVLVVWPLCAAFWSFSAITTVSTRPHLQLHLCIPPTPLCSPLFALICPPSDVSIHGFLIHGLYVEQEILCWIIAVQVVTFRRETRGSSRITMLLMSPLKLLNFTIRSLKCILAHKTYSVEPPKHRKICNIRMDACLFFVLFGNSWISVFFPKVNSKLSQYESSGLESWIHSFGT